MKAFQIFLLIIFIQQSFGILISENIDNSYNFIYPVNIGPDEEAKLFLIDTTRQSTYLFKDNKIASNEDEIETTLEINTLHLKDFEFQLIDNFLDDSNIIKIDGIIGLGTINGKNSFMGQMKSNRLIKSKKVYMNFEDESNKILKFQYEVPKNYENDFTYCPLITYKHSYDKKYHESWMCEMTHILVKNEENEEDINRKIYLNSTYETMGKIIFNPNSNYITAPEIYLHYLKIQYSMNNRNRCSSYKRNDQIYLYCKYEDEKNFEKLPYFGVLIEGYLYKIPVKNLFVKTEEEGSYLSLIRFDKNNNKGHLWEFGLPLFKSFVIEFDFDNRRVGFGEPQIKSENLTSEWIQWYSLNEGLSPRLFASKIIMIIGLICLFTIFLFIFGCALFSYLSNYFKRRNTLNEEVPGQKTIEMMSKSGNVI
jgi:hypothetical protein